MSSQATNGTVAAGEKMLSVVEFLDERDGAELNTIASELDMAKSTAHRHVKTLEENGYLVTRGKEIQLSTAFLRLGRNVRYRTELANIVEPIVEEIADTTEERANFFIEEDGHSVCIHRKLGNRGVVAETELGRQFPMHATAAGKAILSQLPEGRVRMIAREHGLESFTENTITDESALLDELAAIREEGIAYNDEENIENLSSMGVPIATEVEPPCALTVSGPSHRVGTETVREELKETLLGAANELELRLEYE